MTSNNFQIAESLDLGRYLISKENFEQGDIVFEEIPLISAPCERDVSSDDKFSFSCVTCSKRVGDVKCQRCGWPCCSSECSMNEKHRNFECTVFKKMKIPVSSFAYKNILFVRVLICKWNNPPLYKRLLTMCAEYPDASEEEMAVWKFLSVRCNLDVTISEVSKIVAICEINNFKFDIEVDYILEYSGHAIFEMSSLFSHSCFPNLEFSFFKCKAKDGLTVWNIRFYAREAIRIGQVLTIAYGFPGLQLGTIPRQQKILKERLFICKCNRCLDSTEGNTYFSAIPCSKCKRSNFLPVNPIEKRTRAWRCTHCNGRKSFRSVARLIDKLSARPLSLYEMDSSTPQSLTFADTFIETHSGSTLHRNHYLLFQCGMHWLMRNAFPPHLVHRSKEALHLFIKIMRRVRRYLALAVKILPPDAIAHIHFVIAEVLAAYLLQMNGLKAIKQHGYLSSDKVRVARRILSHLTVSQIWIKMSPSNPNYENYITHLEPLISHWSSWSVKLTEESNQLQELTLESVRDLFL